MLNLDISHKNYIKASPYPHCVVENILDKEFALSVQEEILNINDSEWDRYNNPFEQKYTLRNKSNLPANCSKLFNYLTSEECLDKLSTIVGGGFTNMITVII